MNAFANGWRDWVALAIGGYLVSAPWIFGASGDVPGSANARIAGVCLVLVALWALLEAGPRAGEWTRIGIGVWLLASPFVLGFAGSVMAWSTWVAGALIVALTDTPNLALEVWDRLRVKRLSHRAHAVSPQEIIEYAASEEHIADPERLGRQIVERSYQIYCTLQRQPSDVEAEMCALGYQACIDDMITLVYLTGKELSDATFLRRLRLKAARARAARSLSRAHGALPQKLRRSSPHGNEIT